MLLPHENCPFSQLSLLPSTASPLSSPVSLVVASLAVLEELVSVLSSGLIWYTLLVIYPPQISDVLPQQTSLERGLCVRAHDCT